MCCLPVCKKTCENSSQKKEEEGSCFFKNMKGPQKNPPQRVTVSEKRTKCDEATTKELPYQRKIKARKRQRKRMGNTILAPPKVTNNDRREFFSLLFILLDLKNVSPSPPLSVETKPKKSIHSEEKAKNESCFSSLFTRPAVLCFCTLSQFELMMQNSAKISRTLHFPSVPP